MDSLALYAIALASHFFNSRSLSLWLSISLSGFGIRVLAPALVWCVQTASVVFRMFYLLLFILSEFNFECVCGCETNMCTVYPVQQTNTHTPTHVFTLPPKRTEAFKLPTVVEQVLVYTNSDSSRAQHKLDYQRVSYVFRVVCYKFIN